MPGERMSEASFKRWRDRLVYAKRRWEEEGLIGSKASKMRLLIEFYRGNQWMHFANGFGDLDDDDLVTVNKIFVTANQTEGRVAARNPQVRYFPRHEDSVVLAPRAEALHNYDIHEQNHIRQLNRALKDQFVAPSGIIRHGFTPPEEYLSEKGRLMQTYRPSRPARPWIRRVPIWNCLMDPNAESFHMDGDLQWVAFRSLMPLADIRDNPNMIAREEVKDYAGSISPEWEAMLPPAWRHRDDPDAHEAVEVWTVYEIHERTWFQMTLDGLDKPLRNPDDWPIPWEWLPVNVLTVNDQSDVPFGIPLLDQMLPAQIELNKLRTMMAFFVKTIRRILLGNKEKFGDEWGKVVEGALIEWVGVTGDPKDAIQQVQAGGLPQELLLYNQQLEEDIRELGGQSKMGRAQRINVETAHEVERVQQGQDVSEGRIEAAFSKFVTEVEELYIQGRRATMAETGNEIVRIVGGEGAKTVTEWATVSPEDLAGQFGLEVVAGSMRQRDRDREAQKAAAELQIAMSAQDFFNGAYFARRFAEAGGHDPAEALTPQAVQAAKARMLDQMRRTMQPGEEQAAGPARGSDANVLALLTGAGGVAR